jgi:autoinducer 2-degrading protein
VSRFAIIVTIKLKPGTAPEFRRLILVNAAASRQEPDCHRFDVLVSEEDENTLFFYEEYTNAEALEAHRGTPHYQAFREATDEMVLDRKIQRCSVVG